MKSKWIIFILIISISLFSLSGCKSSKEVNDLLLVNTFGIDKIDNRYVITIQVLTPGQIASRKPHTPSTSITYTESGEDLLGTFKKLSSKVPRRIYTNHLNLIVIGEHFARDGISAILDFLVREHQFRANFSIAIVKDISAQDFLETLSGYNLKYHSNMTDALALAEKTWAPISNYTLYPFLDSLIKEGQELALPAVELEVKPTSMPSIHISTMGVFKDDKLMGWLTPHESVGTAFVNDKIKGTFVNITYDDVPVTMDIYKSSTDVTFTRENNELLFNVNVNCNASISAVSGKITWEEPLIYRRLESSCSEKIESLVKDSLFKNQVVYECDIFGFGELLHRDDKEYWMRIKNGWDEIFSNLKVTVSVHTKVDKSDKTLKTLRGKY